MKKSYVPYKSILKNPIITQQQTMKNKNFTYQYESSMNYDKKNRYIISSSHKSVSPTILPNNRSVPYDYSMSQIRTNIRHSPDYERNESPYNISSSNKSSIIRTTTPSTTQTVSTMIYEAALPSNSIRPSANQWNYPYGKDTDNEQNRLDSYQKLRHIPLPHTNSNDIHNDDVTDDDDEDDEENDEIEEDNIKDNKNRHVNDELDNVDADDDDDDKFPDLSFPQYNRPSSRHPTNIENLRCSYHLYSQNPNTRQDQQKQQQQQQQYIRNEINEQHERGKLKQHQKQLPQKRCERDNDIFHFDQLSNFPSNDRKMPHQMKKHQREINQTEKKSNNIPNIEYQKDIHQYDTSPSSDYNCEINQSIDLTTSTITPLSALRSRDNLYDQRVIHSTSNTPKKSNTLQMRKRNLQKNSMSSSDLEYRSNLKKSTSMSRGMSKSTNRLKQENRKKQKKRSEHQQPYYTNIQYMKKKMYEENLENYIENELNDRLCQIAKIRSRKSLIGSKGRFGIETSYIIVWSALKAISSLLLTGSTINSLLTARLTLAVMNGIEIFSIVFILLLFPFKGIRSLFVTGNILITLWLLVASIYPHILIIIPSVVLLAVGSALLHVKLFECIASSSSLSLISLKITEPLKYDFHQTSKDKSNSNIDLLKEKKKILKSNNIEVFNLKLKESYQLLFNAVKQTAENLTECNLNSFLILSQFVHIPCVLVVGLLLTYGTPYHTKIAVSTGRYVYVQQQNDRLEHTQLLTSSRNRTSYRIHRRLTEPRCQIRLSWNTCPYNIDRWSAALHEAFQSPMLALPPYILHSHHYYTEQKYLTKKQKMSKWKSLKKILKQITNENDIKSSKNQNTKSISRSKRTFSSNDRQPIGSIKNSNIYKSNLTNKKTELNQNGLTTIYIVSVCLTFGIIAAMIPFLCTDSIIDHVPIEQSILRKYSLSFWRNMICSKYLISHIFLNFFIGVQTTYFYGDFLNWSVTCPYGIFEMAICLTIYGISTVIGSGISIFALQRINRTIITMIVFFLHCSTLAAIKLINSSSVYGKKGRSPPTQSPPATIPILPNLSSTNSMSSTTFHPYYILVVAFGFCDAIWRSLNYKYMFHFSINEIIPNMELSRLKYNWNLVYEQQQMKRNLTDMVPTAECEKTDLLTRNKLRKLIHRKHIEDEFKLLSQKKTYESSNKKNSLKRPSKLATSSFKDIFSLSASNLTKYNSKIPKDKLIDHHYFLSFVNMLRDSTEQYTLLLPSSISSVMSFAHIFECFGNLFGFLLTVVFCSSVKLYALIALLGIASFTMFILDCQPCQEERMKNEHNLKLKWFYFTQMTLVEQLNGLSTLSFSNSILKSSSKTNLENNSNFTFTQSLDNLISSKVITISMESNDDSSTKFNEYKKHTRSLPKLPQRNEDKQKVINKNNNYKNTSTIDRYNRSANRKISFSSSSLTSSMIDNNDNYNINKNQNNETNDNTSSSFETDYAHGATTYQIRKSNEPKKINFQQNSIKRQIQYPNRNIRLPPNKSIMLSESNSDSTV
ncbi:hypothetical protein SNEBB_002384 [Seison nebaliae]|nr:hypothetical protein SNEBB_002384 [Seison nebaliae]